MSPPESDSSPELVQYTVPAVPIAIAARNPEIILYPQHRGSMDRAPIAERPGWEVLQAVREGRVRVFDAETVVRLGPRVVEAVEALAAALHPETFAGGGSVLEAREEP